MGVEEGQLGDTSGKAGKAAGLIFITMERTKRVEITLVGGETRFLEEAGARHGVDSSGKMEGLQPKGLCKLRRPNILSHFPVFSLTLSHLSNPTKQQNSSKEKGGEKAKHGAEYEIIITLHTNTPAPC